MFASVGQYVKGFSRITERVKSDPDVFQQPGFALQQQQEALEKQEHFAIKHYISPCAFTEYSFRYHHKQNDKVYGVLFL